MSDHTAPDSDELAVRARLAAALGHGTPPASTPDTPEPTTRDAGVRRPWWRRGRQRPGSAPKQSSKPPDQTEPADPDRTPADPDPRLGSSDPGPRVRRVCRGWWHPANADTGPDPSADGPGASPDSADVGEIAPDIADVPGAPAQPVSRGSARPPRRWAATRMPAVGLRRGLLAQPRIRGFVHHAAAAGAGYLTGLTGQLAPLLPAASRSHTATLASVLAVLGALTAWRITAHPAIGGVLPVPGVSRLVLTAFAAYVAHGQAPALDAWLVDRAPLDAPALALTVTAAGVGAVLWLLFDRPARAQHPAVRLAARVPLATWALTCALYAPGTV